MSNSKREPLLSERLWEVIKSLDGNVADWVIDDLNYIHDDLDNLERCAKDAELIQQLVDALEWVAAYDNGCPLPTWEKGYNNAWSIANSARAAAEAAGFKPSDQ